MPDPAESVGHALPTGTLTFLFTDIEGSTRLWEQAPDAMARAHARHGALIAGAVAAHGGTLLRERGEGDSTFSVFPDAARAVAAACAFQRALRAEPWPPEAPLRVRAALHAGVAPLRDGDYNSSDVNRCARLRAVAHGGQTLLSQAAYQLARDRLPPDAGARDLGIHRLKDLSRPERVYQLLHPDLPADFPPLASLDARRTNLPVQVTSFIGRAREMAAVRERLAAHRLLTLTGPGGGGKTRLALQVAADLLDAYPDGVWLVELAGLADAALVPQAVAQALGVREQPGQAVVETLTDALTTRRLLLVLDNCEHLAAACAALVQTLLQNCPDLRVLATSRHAVGLAGTGQYPVPPLSLPPEQAAATPDALAAAESVRLFAERASAASPGFTLTPAEAPAVVQICRRLTGLPLAIELAAAWVDVLSPTRIAARLDDRFRLLTRGNAAAATHHQTLRATLDWSHKLLSAREKTLFARLSVFAGGWTLEAAEDVCAGEGLPGADVLPLLSRLVDKSLVTVEGDGAEHRYGLLETVREYARAKLDSSRVAGLLRARHRDWFLSLAQEAEPHLSGPDPAGWLDRLAAEGGNLSAALEEARAGPAETEAGFADALTMFWYVRGHLRDGLSRLESALRRRAELPQGLSLSLLNSAGMLAWAQGDSGLAAARYAEGLEVARAIGRQGAAAAILNNLGSLEAQQGRVAEALARFQESLAYYRAAGDAANSARLLSNIGALYMEEDEFDLAAASLAESLGTLRQTDPVSLAGALHNLGWVAYKRQDYPAAYAYLREGLAVRQRLGERPGIALSVLALAILESEAGQPDRAARLLGHADARRHEVAGDLAPSAAADEALCRDRLRARLGAGALDRLCEQGGRAPLEELAP